MKLFLDGPSLTVYKALASDTRLDILRILSFGPQNITQLSQEIGLSKAIISRHLHTLEEAELISRNKTTENDNRIKQFTLSTDSIHIEFPTHIFLPYMKEVSTISLGHFTSFDVTPTCGLANKDEYIGKLDDPRTFVSSNRVNASILWFSSGYVEYIIPNPLSENCIPELLEITLEISSEFPTSNNNWPSDISFYINNQYVGYYTISGNYSDVVGRLNPAWWDRSSSQYGELKHLCISQKDTGINGKKISDVTINQLNITDSAFISIKIACKKNAQNSGGITIFGKEFGNHQQDIITTLYYSQKNSI